MIDAKTNELVTTVPVGIRPGPIAAGGGFVWVGNLQDRNLSKLGAQGTRRQDDPARRPDTDRAGVRRGRSLGGARTAGGALSRWIPSSVR